MTEWSLDIGQTLSRSERMRIYGGGLQGGINPSAKSPNIFIYSDPLIASRYGYNYDGWANDSVFLYTGDGSSGDQKLRAGNRSVERHLSDGKALRVFVADGKVPGKNEKVQRYLGEFVVDTVLPYVRAEAPDVDKVLRSVIVFRLRPVGQVLRRPEDRSKFPDVVNRPETAVQLPAVVTPDLLVDGVPLEVVGETEFEVSAQSARVASRRESLLVDRFRIYLESLGHKVGRFELRPPAELRSLYTDLFDFSDETLYEAKAATTREAVRMAIGQLYDYTRHVPQSHSLAVLLPGEPSRDLVSLLAARDIRCVCEVDGDFVTVT
ncbi:restriction endonuclease [Kribbella italica]|uniref:5-methylcytosine-specific restriction protein A n=1 Tax=Kribbella italica TaxID=1540520 RepID=A0A7W9J660_9ACTN|nr:restriction endonuclease [Kribbella italica]MBB5836329.1 5-methylcytosine-specific restriction protein A [Kribbella italica]